MELATRGNDPARVVVRSGVRVESDDMIRASFTVAKGDHAGFSLCWIAPDAIGAPEPTEPEEVAARIRETVWRSWDEEHEMSAGTHRRLAELAGLARYVLVDA